MKRLITVLLPPVLALRHAALLLSAPLSILIILVVVIAKILSVEVFLGLLLLVLLLLLLILLPLPRGHHTGSIVSAHIHVVALCYAHARLHGNEVRVRVLLDGNSSLTRSHRRHAW